MNKFNNRRKAAGLTFKELALAANVNKRTLEGYAQGRRNIGEASYNDVVRIAKALGVQPEEIVE